MRSAPSILESRGWLFKKDSSRIHGNLRYPPHSYPPINKALLRDYCQLASLKALLGLFLGGGSFGGVPLGGGTLGSHDCGHMRNIPEDIFRLPNLCQVVEFT